MRADSIVFAIAGMCFGVILGWVIGVQQAGGRFSAPAPASAPAQGAAAGQPQAPPLDEARVQSLMTVIKNDPKNAGAAVQLGNTYFDAERYADAIKWYEESLRIDPSNPDASTDLGVSLYYTGQTDRALQQFSRSLKLNPKHTKTLLNQGIVKFRTLPPCARTRSRIGCRAARTSGRFGSKQTDLCRYSAPSRRSWRQT